MKRTVLTITIAIGLIALLTPLVWGQQYHDPPQDKSQQGDPLDIEVWTNKEEGATYGQGENLVIYFRANRDCWVTIYDLDTHGNLNILFPFDTEDEHYVEANVVYTIPDYYDDYVLRVNGPPGMEYLQAVASLNYFDVPDWEYNYRDEDLYEDLDSDARSLRYLENINNKYFPVSYCYGGCDQDYTFFEVRKDWEYSWDSYYNDDYNYYDDNRVEVHHYYHPYYYRPVYYDPWWDPWDWYGCIYVDYPFGGEVWINGIFYGYAPLFIPRVSIGWCNVRVWYNGRDYYHDRVKIRRGLDHQLYSEGGYKWKTVERKTKTHTTVTDKYYPRERSISYKSHAEYTLGGKSGNTRVTKNRTDGFSGKTDYKGTSGKSYDKIREKTSYMGSKYEKKGSNTTANKKSSTYDKGSKTSTSSGKSSKSGTNSKTTYDKGKSSSSSKSKASESKSKSSSSKSKSSYEKSKSSSSKSKSSGTKSKSSYNSGNKSGSSSSSKSSSSYKSRGSSSQSSRSTSSRSYGSSSKSSSKSSSSSSRSGSKQRK